MEHITFVTGNKGKAAYFERLLQIPVNVAAIDLDEIQSLDLHAIVEHKARQAYEKMKSPVIVDDAGIEFEAFGKLPGPFIKFFEKEIGFESMCRLLDGKSRRAIARTVIGYCDETGVTIFEGSLGGEIAERPVEGRGFGFDCIFIPDGYTTTRSQLSDEDDEKTYLQIKPIDAVRTFLRARKGN